ncbi:Queuine tRNA-ribosyltransferase subunit qtrtd1 [Gamsiella multidivaricata]|nr:Queuine tRNA-ribosyltransferase subunit qtrtd1 [Gamsiella multidivaricata]
MIQHLDFLETTLFLAPSTNCIMSPLDFDIYASSPQSAAARLGKLSISNKAEQDGITTKRVIQTPGCFMYSIKGSVPHLTPDNRRLQDFGGVIVSLEEILQTDQPTSFSNWPSISSAPFKFTLADYLHLCDLILLCDLRNNASPTTDSTKLGSNTDRHVLLSTPKGVRQLTLDDYLQIARQYRPDIIASLADNIAETQVPSQKRVRKSIERTLKWLDQILLERQGGDGRIADRRLEEEKRRKKEEKERRRNMTKEQQQQQEDADQQPEVPAEVQPIATDPWMDVAVFAHVQGSQFEEERILSAKETAQRSAVDGFIMDAKSLAGACTKAEILKHIETSIEHLPPQKPRLLYGVNTPEDVLKAIPLGVDLFDTSYPYQLTEDGKASLYCFGHNLHPSSSPLSSYSTSNGNKRWINLWDEEHGDKFIPLLEGCECYACKGGRHTRAYINHLLKAHEMLATVLLMSHNMYQYSKFFAAVREAIKEGTLEQHSKVFDETFGAEPVRTSEKHAAQIVVEAALSKRNQRLEAPESGAVDAIGMGDDKTTKKRPDDEDASNENKKVKKAEEEEITNRDIA